MTFTSNFFSTSASNAAKDALAAQAGRDSIETAATEEMDPYWEDGDWVPVQKNGKQRTPKMIRNELQRYIDNTGCTQASVIEQLGVSRNSFYKFMNPRNYKDSWRAIENSTYWNAARFLEARRNKPPKRKATSGVSGNNRKKARSDVLDQALRLMERIQAVPLDNTTNVYDSCPDVIRKIKGFLARDGVTKAMFCRTLDGLSNSSLDSFLASKKQDGAGLVAYSRAYFFFERLCILEETPKSETRLRNEIDSPQGFPLLKPRRNKRVYVTVNELRSMSDALHFM